MSWFLLRKYSIHLEKEDVELLGLADSVLKSFESGLREKKIEVRISGEEVHVNADRIRLGQVIANLRKPSFMSTMK